jgi:hypothetical protein
MFGRQQQMNMIGDQDVGMQPARFALQRLVQPSQVGEAVLIIEEAR